VIKKWIEDALEYSQGTHDISDVMYSISIGEMQLFANKGGCVVTQITQYPQKKVLFVFLAGGELDSVISLHDEVISYAKSKNCDTLMQVGRMGWTKELKKHGWKNKSACMTRNI
jgi:hypothetical protein